MKATGTGPAIPSSDFLELLRAELIRRCRENPRYSLRAFARFLRVDASFLSKVLARKRSLTRPLVLRLGAQLGMAPDEVGRFVEALPGKGMKGALLADGDDGFRQLTLDHFNVIADWYHYAILELVAIPGSRPSARWISGALGITSVEAQAALDRLKRLGMIEVSGQGTWRNASGNNTTLGSDFTAIAFRKLQRQVLEMAIDALENVPIERRDQTSVTLAIDSRDLPRIKSDIRSFRRELAARYQRPRIRPDSVYHLGVSFYPVTRVGRSRKGSE